MSTKSCSNKECKMENPQTVQSFSKNNARPDGLQPVCKNCDRQKYLDKKGSEARVNRKHKNNTLWTLEEENKFRVLFYNKTRKELEIEFNKSKTTLLRKAQELGLKKVTYESKFYPITKIPPKWNISGVYAIINTKMNRLYIGSSINILERLKQHYINKPDSMIKDWDNDYIKVAIIKSCPNYLEEEHKYLGNPNLYNSFISPELPVLNRYEIKRFNKRYIINSNGCWIWDGYIGKGYGTFQVNNIEYAAHRISYLIYKGKYNKALLLRHQCNNKSCVNPEHLILGTDAQNQHDRKRVGKANKYGTTWEEVQKIREDWQSGQYSLANLRVKYGFDVNGICQNISWIDKDYIRPKFKTGKRGMKGVQPKQLRLGD